MYVIECIETDAPYFSLGYWGGLHLVGAISKAMRFNDEEEVRKACQYIRREYDGNKHVRLMPWVFGITADGKLGKRFMNLER